MKNKLKLFEVKYSKPGVSLLIQKVFAVDSDSATFYTLNLWPEATILGIDEITLPKMK